MGTGRSGGTPVVLPTSMMLMLCTGHCLLVVYAYLSRLRDALGSEVVLVIDEQDQADLDDSRERDEAGRPEQH
jgi:hypothetical protein